MDKLCPNVGMHRQWSTCWSASNLTEPCTHEDLEKFNPELDPELGRSSVGPILIREDENEE